MSKLYKYVFKPLAFRFDPEFAHDQTLRLGKTLGKYKLGRAIASALFYYSSPMLKQRILGVNFPNPIGLAAGFDKNAELLDILPSVGFGFAEVGSITGEPCKGNPKKRLWRLPKSQSLAVYYGLKNDGAEAISKRLQGRGFAAPVGISVAKTNSPATVERLAGIADYVKAYKLFADIGSYATVNISCPNAFGGEPFADSESLDLLLTELDKIATKKPMFIKLTPDLSDSEVSALIEVIGRHRVAGIICSNTTKNRNNPRIQDSQIPSVGGLSGKVVEELANKQIAYVYKLAKGKYIIIGCGGVFTAADAYKKIRLGASLIQLITGMVYKGPQVVGEINKGLVDLLKRDGLKNISEAIGVDNKY